MSIVRAAAGGLLWRETPSGPQLVVVHGPREDGWSLPRRKLEGAGSWKDAALREVHAETGCQARITRFAGASFDLGRRDPEIVLYWHMALVREERRAAGGEIEGVAWLSPAVALSRLRHAGDRRLVARALRRGAHASPARRPRLAAWAGAGVVLAAGLVLGVAVGTPAKRRAFMAGGATGLVGAASAAIAAFAAARRRPRR